jgi:hypothetical protein
MIQDTGRPSAATLLVMGRGIAAAQDAIADEWAEWIAAREPGAQALEPTALTRALRLILGCLTHMAGPLRRDARDTWYAVTELFGRLAEARGLSAGEVVDELQHLREILIVRLGDLIVAMPARLQMPAVLRVNRVCDLGVSNAVVGYTDALVAKMFSRDGVPVPTADSLQDLLKQLDQLEMDVRELDRRLAR